MKRKAFSNKIKLICVLIKLSIYVDDIHKKCQGRENLVGFMTLEKTCK